MVGAPPPAARHRVIDSCPHTPEDVRKGFVGQVSWLPASYRRRLPIYPSRQWRFTVFVPVTVAGTAPVLHRLPFAHELIRIRRTRTTRLAKVKSRHADYARRLSRRDIRSLRCHRCWAGV